jgi:hypothetical protein
MGTVLTEQTLRALERTVGLRGSNKCYGIRHGKDHDSVG